MAPDIVFQLEHLSLTQPVALTVIAEQPSRPLDVRLAKYNFDSVERQARTDSRGQVSFQFRTEGDLLILVRANPRRIRWWCGSATRSRGRCGHRSCL